MPERSSGSDQPQAAGTGPSAEASSAARLSSTAARTGLKRLRVMSSGRWRPPVDAPPTSRTARLLAVSSALPGAGKSVIASNLAAAIAGLGRDVVLVDLDVKAPRQHALLGVPPPSAGLTSWLSARRQQTDDAPTTTKVRNLRLLPCLPIGDERSDLDVRQGLVSELYSVDGDVVVVDVGTENRADLFDGFATRAHRLLVTGVDLPSLEATYALLAGVVARAERRHGRSAQAALARFCGGLIGNGTAAPVDAERLHAFARVVRERLNLPLPVLACFQSSSRIPDSITARQPLVTRRGLDQNVTGFHQLADLLLADDIAPLPGCPLDVAEPIEIPVAPLPVAIERYERKFPRFPVDWAATVEFPAGSCAVRVHDVSESGVGLETSLPLRIGDTGRLQLYQLPGSPVVAVQVKSLLPAVRRIGLGFVKRDRHTARIAAAARRAS
jgi:MinD-like ATPase involved in chromosome partitioning or flagellar assembly